MRRITSRRGWLLLSALGAAALLVTGCTAWRLGEARALARASEPFQQQPATPALRLLVLGDSTGVGTGASAPAFSVAGLLGTAHPRLAVDNRSRDGARFGEMPEQLAAAAGGSAAVRWDVILVSAGGNDVIRGTDTAALAQAIDRSLAAARARLAPGGLLLVQPPGNVGHAPFFVPPVSALMNRRAADLHAAVREAAARHGATMIDMARPREQDPFVLRPELNASDGLHPSDAGYRVWRDELLAQSRLGPRLEAAR
jgi:lysophospholipase L1-like esterase